MKQTRSSAPKIHSEPVDVRRKLAAAYSKEAADPKWTPTERAEFSRMADSWARTLPKEGRRSR